MSNQSNSTGNATARILIVEDDWIVATVSETALIDAGYRVVGIAYTARDALKMAEAHRPDLILYDIKLSTTTDGIDAAVHTFKRFGIRPLFVSAHTDDEGIKALGKAAQPLGWVGKPFTTRELLDAVGLALRVAKGSPQTSSAAR